MSRVQHIFSFRSSTFHALRLHRSQRWIHTDNRFFKISAEVRRAIESKKPVVALETTIYTHGFPHPENLQLALYLESIVRANGAIPATIGVLDGIARVGLQADELKALIEKPRPRKISRRDIAFASGLGLHGGTTISGTMLLAHMAGIKVFATGGLGGVHRGGQASLDISADLTELGRTPVAVICSGCKGFLDINRTLEFLETEGVGVATFAEGGEGDVDFPAFWSRDSGVKSPSTIQDSKAAATIIHAHNAMTIDSGLLFANPVPEKHSIPREDLQQIIADAIHAADQASATGADNTPFILQAIKDLSGSKSITANEALIEANVAKGSEVAIELSELDLIDAPLYTDSACNNYFVQSSAIGNGLQEPVLQDPQKTNSSPLNAARKVDILVAGSIAIDLSCDYIPAARSADQIEPVLKSSNPGTIIPTLGGVGHNVTRAAQLTGAAARLCSIVANDIAGKTVLVRLEAEGLDASAVKVISNSLDSRTAQYVAVNNANKDLMVAVADMSIFEKVNAFEGMWAAQLQESQPKWVVVDANWSQATLRTLLVAAKEERVMIAVEPVSTAKSVRIMHTRNASDPLVFPNTLIDLITPNAQELSSMYVTAKSSGLFERQDWWAVIDAMGIPATGARNDMVKATSAALVDSGIPQQAIQLLPFLPCILTKLGSNGVILTMLLSRGDERLHSPEALPYILSRGHDGSDVGGVYLRHYRATEELPAEHIKSVNGAGDTLLGAIVSALTQKEGSKIEEVVEIGQRAALRTLKSTESVAPDLMKA